MNPGSAKPNTPNQPEHGRGTGPCQTGQSANPDLRGAPGQLRISPPFSPEDRTQIRDALESGRVMAYPTETSYALGGNALHPHLVDEIYRLKGRDRSKPLLLLLDGGRDLTGWVRDLPEAARLLIRSVWPGPLTLVVHAGPALPPHIQDDRGRVAVRWSPHPALAALFTVAHVPLIGTSANLSGTPSLNDAGDVLRAFGTEPLIAIDGGPAPGGLPSTVLDTTVIPFAIVREGATPVARIRALLAPAFPACVPA
jgi:L-threonylcarbamoyladenylate synthase